MYRRSTIIITLAAVLIPILLALLCIFDGTCVSVKMTVAADDKSVEISDNLLGIFFEDINYAADGGIAANLIQNNSFEYKYVEMEKDDLSLALTSWKAEGAEVTLSKPMSDNNPACLKIDLGTSGTATVLNFGYPDIGRGYGIYLRKDTAYDFSMYRATDGFDGTVTLDVVDEGGDSLLLSTYNLSISSNPEYEKTSALGFTPKNTGYGAVKLTVSGSGTLYLDMFSLIARDSFGYDDDQWKYTSLRADLVQALTDLNPSFVRFPGGCLTEGSFLHEYSYNWKTTVGELTDRIQIPNLWGYNQSMEVGFYEYFLLSEHLNAEPIPVLNAGITCQSRRFWTHNDKPAYLEMDVESAEFATLIDDYLDLIEYANGDTSTYWGAVRAENGHPEPFNLKYIGVGNENWDFALYGDTDGDGEEDDIIGWNEAYFSRFDLIYKAITEAYPDVTVISSAGPGAHGAEFEHAWEKIDASYSDTVVDEHYYVKVWEMSDVFSTRYDSYDRDGARVFVGEYSANTGGDWNIAINNLAVAISEAAFLTGVERNGDIVELCAYAPLFSKYGRQQWIPDLIWFELDSVIYTPSYYVQQLFMQNTGDIYLNSAWKGKTDGLYKSVVVDTENEVIIVKIVNNTDTSRVVKVNLDGFTDLNNYASLQYFGSAYLNRFNSPDEIQVPPTVTDCISTRGDKFKVDTGAYSVNVIRIGYGNNTTESKESIDTTGSFWQYLDKKYDEYRLKFKDLFR